MKLLNTKIIFHEVCLKLLANCLSSFRNLACFFFETMKLYPIDAFAVVLLSNVDELPHESNGHWKNYNIYF